MNKAIIFDFDGVIIHSREVQRQALFESYKMVVGEGSPSFEEFLKHSGDSLPNIFKKMSLPLEMVEPYREVSRKNMHKIEVHDGIMELLGILKKEGFRCGLCTGKDRKRTIEILQNTQLITFFDAIVCSDDVSYPKPHSESLLRCIQLLDSSNDRAVMIGDAKNDIQCAKNATVKSIAVAWGDNSAEMLLEEEPNHIVYSVLDLCKCIFKIHNLTMKKDKDIKHDMNIMSESKSKVVI